MKKIFLRISALSLVLLCACTTKENDEKPIMTPTPTATVAPTQTPLPTPTNTPAATPTLTADVLAQRYINGLERMDISELNGFVDKEDSIRNSNLMNYGYVTYDEEGNLYYVDQNTHEICVSDYNGENKRVICQTNDKFTSMLQLSGEWMYYNTGHTAIMRVHIETGEIEQVAEEHSGPFFIKDEKIYLSWNGLSVMDLDGKNEVVIDDTFLYSDFPTYSTEYGISYIADFKLRWKGYLLVFDGESTKVLKQRGIFPLLAGNYLCMSDAGNARDLSTKFRVWNLKTNREYELGLYADQTVVSDGETIYFSRDGYNNQSGRMWNGEELKSDKMYTFFYRWNETMTKPELFWILTEAHNGIYNIFLTPKAIYAEDSEYKADKPAYTLFYYDLETGETGQVY